MEKTTITLNKTLDTKGTAKLVQLAGQYCSDVNLTAREITVDAKSIMGVMMLALRNGLDITITAKGKDAKDAIEALEKELV